jgi:HD-GYP domain-containing protein (c-di-GMP phosphodiesterase class II)
MRLGEMLGALSLATDLAAGTPLETSLRTCVVATRLARALALPDLVEVRRVALLRHLGCTAFAHEAAALAGSDHDLLATFAGVDLASRTAVASRTLGKLARGEPLGRRLAILARAAVHPGAAGALIGAQCAQAVALAEDLGLPGGVIAALGQIYEHHDGRGAPNQLAGDAIRPAARVLHVAELAVIHHRTFGRDAALAEVARRRGKHLAPDVVDAFVALAPELWPLLEESSVWDRYLDADEPDQPALDVDRVARAFGRYADLKSPFTLGHAEGVAELAAAAAPEPRVRTAALLHDLGMVSVPNGIWDKPGPLNAAEWERVRLHGYHTQRILAQTPLLAELAPLAGAHHERLDGSGYHRGASAPQLEHEARVLAAADAYRAMREHRPYRPALAADAAADALAADARDGKLCRRAVDAVLGAAGRAAPERTLPAGLTPREVEVLVQLARGATNKQIAASLGIAVRTANHHVENIYAKIHVTTRAAAALFAVRNELIPRE